MSDYLDKLMICCIGAYLGLMVQLEASFAADDRPPFDIFMVQWRGDTQTEQGFKDFFENSRIPVNYYIQNPQQDRSKFQKIVTEIKARKPDLVYTWGTDSAQGVVGKSGDDLANFITDIPVVACMVSDPAVAGLADGWGPTRKNFTGVSHVPDMAAQLRAMQSFKRVNKIAIVYNSQQASPVGAAQKLEKLAKAEGISVSSLSIPLGEDGASNPQAIAETVAKLATFDPDYLYIGPDSFLFVNRKELFEAVNTNNLATFTPVDVFLSRSDALFGLVGSYYSVGQYCGYKAAEILVNGQDPGDIPFDTLRHFSLKANMETAQNLQIFPPMNMLSLTDVIKVHNVN